MRRCLQCDRPLGQTAGDFCTTLYGGVQLCRRDYERSRREWLREAETLPAPRRVSRETYRADDAVADLVQDDPDGYWVAPPADVTLAELDALRDQALGVGCPTCGDFICKPCTDCQRCRWAPGGESCRACVEYVIVQYQTYLDGLLPHRADSLEPEIANVSAELARLRDVLDRLDAAALRAVPPIPRGERPTLRLRKVSAA